MQSRLINCRSMNDGYFLFIFICACLTCLHAQHSLSGFNMPEKLRLDEAISGENTLISKGKPMLLNKALGFLLNRKRGSCCSCVNCDTTKEPEVSVIENNDAVVDEEPAEANNQEEIDFNLMEEKAASISGGKRRFRIGLSYPGKHNGGHSALTSGPEFRTQLALRGGLRPPFGANSFGFGNSIGTGLGLGSSLGIYDNGFASAASKPAVLRRKLIPNEGILLLEVEDRVDPYGDTYGNGNGPSMMNNGYGPLDRYPMINGLGIPNTINGIHSGRPYGYGGIHRNGLGKPKFSVQLTNAEMRLDESNSMEKHQLIQPHLSEKNLQGLVELSKNPHENGAGGRTVARIRVPPVQMKRGANKMMSLPEVNN